MADKREQYLMRFAIENGRVVISEMGQIGAAGDKAMKQISDGSDLLNQSLNVLYGGIKGRLLAVLGPTALLYSVNRAVSSLADLSREAERAGNSAEYIQKYNYAAEKMVGTSVGMADALAEFNKRLGEAFAGEGELAEILKRYNIELTDQNGKRRDANDILLDYADAVKEAVDQSEKLLLVDKGFGNTSLVKVFDQGRDGLERLGQEAERAGRVIEDELIARAREFDDIYKDLMATAETRSKAGIVAALDLAVQMFEKLKDSAADAALVVEGFWAAFKNPAADIFPINPYKNPDGMEAIQREIRKRAQDRGADMHTDFISPSHPDYIEPAAPGARSPVKTKQQIADEDAAAKRLQNVIDLLKFRNEQMKRTNAEQELYNQLRAAGVELDSAAGQQIQILVAEHQKWEDQQRKARETIEATKKAYDGFFDRIIDGFEDGKISAEEFTQAALEMLKQVLTTRDSVTGQNIGGQIITGMAKDIGGLFRGIFGFENGGIMTARGPLPLRMYDNGGIANSPQVAIYGEGKRPEAYVPLPDGRSIPVTMRGGMQTAINLTLIDSAGVDIDVQQGRNGRDMTIVLNKAMTGQMSKGTFDKSMRDRYGVQRALRET